jgi:uncharacterized protein (DUF305 family)
MVAASFAGALTLGALALGALPATTAAFAQHGGAHGAQQGHGPVRMGTSALQSLRALRGKPFDVAFLSQMIAHHQAALKMARDARPTLQDEHVQEHAQEIITSQTKEIREMGALLKNDYHTAPSAAQMTRMKADMQGMMRMKPAGDRMFLEMMIPHHQGAVDMSRLALRNSASPKVKALANRIIKAQATEIADFRRMLSQGVGKGASHSH